MFSVTELLGPLVYVVLRLGLLPSFSMSTYDPLNGLTV